MPTFSCRAASLLAEAGREGSRRAGHPGQRARARRAARTASLTLTLTGRLGLGPRESCTCCGEERHDVPLHLDFVVLSPLAATSARVPLAAFRSPALRLNRGYLQRALEHANDCHREDLGQVVVRTTGTPAEQLLDARLSDLTTHGAELAWIDREGGHRVSLWFSRPAGSVEELGVLLRQELHAGHLLTTPAHTGGCRSPRSPTTSGSLATSGSTSTSRWSAASAGLLVVDTHASAVAAREVIEDVRALGAGEVVAVVNTHEHFDHTFGNGAFRTAYGAVPVHAHEVAAEQHRRGRRADQGGVRRARQPRRPAPRRGPGDRDRAGRHDVLLGGRARARRPDGRAGAPRPRPHRRRPGGPGARRGRAARRRPRRGVRCAGGPGSATTATRWSGR